MAESNNIDATKVIWRIGRKVGRTVYAQIGEIPSDNDILIGMFDTRELAKEAVQAHNFTINKTTNKHSAEF